MMKTNVGGLDRTLRIIAGIVIIAAGFYFKNWWGAVGLIPLFTGSIGWCPAYLPFGISSCAVDKSDK
jgi:sulfite exporter TauE/SafE